MPWNFARTFCINFTLFCAICMGIAAIVQAGGHGIAEHCVYPSKSDFICCLMLSEVGDLQASIHICVTSGSGYCVPYQSYSHYSSDLSVGRFDTHTVPSPSHR